MSEATIQITKYGSRNWAVFVDGRLLCVTVYKKGAVAVRDALLDLGSNVGRVQNSDSTPRLGIENPSVMI